MQKGSFDKDNCTRRRNDRKLCYSMCYEEREKL